MSCYHCGASVDNGLALCDLCQRKARAIFDVLPIYFRNLARWRPGRAGARPVPGSRVLYDGETRGDQTGDRISDRLDEAANALTTWARQLADARPYLGRLLDRLALAKREERIDEAQMVAWLCKGFDRYLTSVATIDWCGEFLRDLDHHETVLRGLTETSVPGWYAGGCKRCDSGTYVVPGLTWVTCGGCGVTTYARDHLEMILDEARPWVAAPKAIAQAIVALLDTEASVPRLHERMKKWAQREKITAIYRTERSITFVVEGDEVVPRWAEVAAGRPRYQLGEVLDLLFREGATRRAEDEARAS
ncbi:MAG: hypothetical protein ACXVXP_00160 [Mycobacteriaceae bacterium]